MKSENTNSVLPNKLSRKLRGRNRTLQFLFTLYFYIRYVTHFSISGNADRGQLLFRVTVDVVVRRILNTNLDQ